MYFFIWSFQNHIPLKHSSHTIDLPRQRFGTVYHHIKLHISQTTHLTSGMEKKLWDHIKLHISQTRRRAGNPAVRFTTICLSNMPLNFLSSFEACLPYKITYFSNAAHLPYIRRLELVYHTKLHTSQTHHVIRWQRILLVYHTKLHTSQTPATFNIYPAALVYHIKLHTSQTKWLDRK